MFFLLSYSFICLLYVCQVPNIDFLEKEDSLSEYFELVNLNCLQLRNSLRENEVFNSHVS